MSGPAAAGERVPGERVPGERVPGERAPVDVAITEDVWGAPLEELARTRSVLRSPAAWQSPAELAAAASRARALVVRNRSRVDRELLEACPRLRVVGRAGVGLDNIDLDAAGARGVIVVAPLGANAASVAEHALGLALGLARRVVPANRDCRRGGWDRTPGRELSGAVWGLLGAGATGRACGRLAAAIGMRVLAYDPYAAGRSAELAAAGIRLAPLAEVTASADILSCHLPATAQTRHFVNAELIAQMRPGALLINVGRGAAVDEDALTAALESGHLGGAGLDVREREPPRCGVLETLDNVILTPHVAGITAQSQDRILRALAADISAVLDGRSPSFPVTTAAVSAAAVSTGAVTSVSVSTGTASTGAPGKGAMTTRSLSTGNVSSGTASTGTPSTGAVSTGAVSTAAVSTGSARITAGEPDGTAVTGRESSAELTVAGARRLAADLLVAAGMAVDRAETTALCVVLADAWGVGTHGLLRLPYYLRRMLAGGHPAGAELAVVTDTGPVLALDGGGGVGHWQLWHAGQVAAERCRQYGIAAVTVANSGHCGALGVYTVPGLEAGYLTLVFSHGPAVMPPWGSSDPLLSTSPIAAGIPVSGGPVIVDMATSTVARGKIAALAQRGEPLPPGWALDSRGPADDRCARRAGGPAQPARRGEGLCARAGRGSPRRGARRPAVVDRRTGHVRAGRRGAAAGSRAHAHHDRPGPVRPAARRRPGPPRPAGRRGDGSRRPAAGRRALPARGTGSRRAARRGRGHHERADRAGPPTRRHPARPGAMTGRRHNARRKAGETLWQTGCSGGSSERPASRLGPSCPR